MESERKGEKVWRVATVDGKEVAVPDGVMQLFDSLELGQYEADRLELDLREDQILYVLKFVNHIEQHGEPATAVFTDKQREIVLELKQKELFDILLKAHFYKIKPMVDYLCKYIASLIRGKTPEEIRSAFAIIPLAEPDNQ